MGGASTEIAFEVNPTATNSSYYVKEKIFNESHSIYARSYLCYGHKEAHGRFLSHLIKINNVRIYVCIQWDLDAPRRGQPLLVAIIPPRPRRGQPLLVYNIHFP